MFPSDSGPIYRETLMGRLPVEPWNTFSNIVFLLVAVYWACRVYSHVRRHLFLAAALPVIFIGFIGGTVFHATRSHELWLVMDWLPITLLCLAVTILFARRAGIPLAIVAVLLMAPFGLRFMMEELFEWSPTLVLNIGYAVLGSIVLTPMVLHLQRTGRQHAGVVLIAAGCFTVAVIFRTLDRSSMFADFDMGTHWLWHAFGGLAVHFLIRYIHLDDLGREEMQAIPVR